MGPAPGPRYTIERKNNARGYTPGNCRWATQKENNRNKRNNHVLEFNGQAQCLAAWAEELGVPRETLKSRLARGWSAAEAIVGRRNAR
jgi:hypothetical protein